MIDFDVDIRGFQEFSQEAVKGLEAKEQLQVLRGFAMKFIGEVVPRTPVDTGRVRGGWTAMRGSSRGLSLGPEARQGRAVSSYKEGTKGSQAYVEIFNGVPYVVYLELGSSQQAPSGFVRLTIREMSKEMAEDMVRAAEAELRLANIKSRRLSGLRQGIGRRPSSGRLNIGRR